MSRKNLRTATTLIKPIFSLSLVLILLIQVKDKTDFICQVAEVLVVFFIGEILLKKNETLGRWINGFLYLLVNLQLYFKFFAGSYLNLLMVSNLNSLSDLGDTMPIYILGIAIIVVFSFLPAISILPGSSSIWISSCTIGVILFLELFCIFYSCESSPLFSYYLLIDSYFETRNLSKSVQNGSADRFYQPDIINAVSKPNGMVEKPNVILLFVEGLSQHIIDDPRNIMTNVSKYQKKSFSFENYYNHTFATFCGLSGQLYSGYQLNSLDENHLVSLQSVFHDCGYHTTIINSEPYLADMVTLLSNFGFDTFISEEGTYNGAGNSLSDKEAFARLIQSVETDLSLNQPFFTAMYTVGTHAGMDSPDEKFGEGKEAEINKFYNLDVQFGHFMDWFVNSSAYQNTIIVFTADHATYVDKYYRDAFPDAGRTVAELDCIPFFIFGNGVSPEVLDVRGRNSLDLSPTILDYLDISVPNYFLGTSLFIDKDSPDRSVYDTTFNTMQLYYRTDECIIRKVNAKERIELLKMMQAYFAAKQSDCIL